MHPCHQGERTDATGAGERKPDRRGHQWRTVYAETVSASSHVAQVPNSFEGSLPVLVRNTARRSGTRDVWILRREMGAEGFEEKQQLTLQLFFCRNQFHVGRPVGGLNVTRPS